ncbi:MAG: type IX secretion system membrane protein PorP/SprF [Bacteroidales bacterium]|nr:type IX secretion system membrane protein PorP/SprF [Bacteroidales bacterium]
MRRIKGIVLRMGLLLSLTGTVQAVFAQKDAVVFSQQMFSSVNFNPAAIRTENQVQASLFGRHQWLGFQGAPTSVMLNLQGYVGEIRSGFSASIIGDRFGHSHTLDFKAGYSYHVRLGGKNTLQFGLSAGFMYKNFRGSDVILDQNGDPIIDMEDHSDVKPDVDFGIAFSSGGFMLGVSATHLTSFAYSKDDYFRPDMGLYLFATYTGRISDKFSLQPYVRAMYVNTALKFEVDLRAEILRWFYIGAGYRYNEAVMAMAGITIHGKVAIGYCYDIGMGKIKNYQSGSHEIMISLRLPTNSRIGDVTRDTPRYFGGEDLESLEVGD